MSVGGLLVINSAAPIAVRFGLAAILGLIVSVFNGVGRPLTGTLLDTIGRRRAMALNSFIMLSGGVVLLFGSLSLNPVFICIGFPLMGISYGGAPTLLAGVINGIFGPKNYQIILGTATCSLGVSAVIGPLLSSRLQESSGGEYTSSFVIIIVAAFLSLLLSTLLDVFLRRSESKRTAV